MPGPHNPRCYFNDRQTPFYGPSCVKWTDKRYNPSEYFTFRNARSRGVVEIYRTLNSRMRRERGVPSAAARFGPRHLVSGGAGRSTSHKLRRPPVHGGGAGGLHPPRQLCGGVDLRLLRLGHSIRRRRCGRKVPRSACTVDHTRWVRAARRRVRQGCRASAAGVRRRRALARVSELNDVLAIRFTPAPYSCSWRKACNSAPWPTP